MKPEWEPDFGPASKRLDMNDTQSSYLVGELL